MDTTTTTNPRKTNGAARRAVCAQVLAEETDCAICGDPVDKTLTVQWGQHGPRCTDPACPGCVPHPDRPEVDEIVPVSLGGSPYERSNCRLTHRHCNQKRGNGTRTPKPTRTATDYPLSECWSGLFDSLKREAQT